MPATTLKLTDKEREKLVTDNLRLVRTIAANVQKKFNLAIPLDDLISDGNVGLVDAVSRYDPREVASFATYAGYRIRGSILDGVRKSGALPRAVYKKIREERAANEYLQSVADEPVPPEGKSLEARAERVEETIAGVATVVLLAIDAVPEDDLTESSDLSRPEKSEFDPILRGALAKALATLRPEDREFLRKVYVDDKIFAELAGPMKRSRSWVTRHHQSLIAKLRDAIGPMEDGAT